MIASDLMTSDVKSCSADDTLHHAAQIMWGNDCGVVPVVDADGCVVGVVTDRDIAMGAYLNGKALADLRVSTVMAKDVYFARESDHLDDVAWIMRRERIRRVPVVDDDGHLAGILSLNDLVRHVGARGPKKADGLSAESVVKTLAAVGATSASVLAERPVGR